MRSSYVLKTLVSSLLFIFAGCGGDHKKSKSDAPSVQEDQTNTDESSEDEDGEKNSGTQPPVVKPPVNPNPPVVNPPVVNPPVVNPPVVNPPNPSPPAGDPTFGQIITADQTSIQTKLLNHYCVACHRGATPAANLNLEDLTPYVTGDLGANGYRGILLYPGRSDISTLNLVIARHESFPAMPPIDNVLKIPAVTAQQVQAVSTWIDGLTPINDDGGLGRN